MLVKRRLPTVTAEAPKSTEKVVTWSLFRKPCALIQMNVSTATESALLGQIDGAMRRAQVLQTF